METVASNLPTLDSMLVVLVEPHCHTLLFVLLVVGEYNLPVVIVDLVFRSLLVLAEVPVSFLQALLPDLLRSLHGERQLPKVVVLAASLLIVETAMLVVPVVKVVLIVLASDSSHLVVRLVVRTLRLVVLIDLLASFGLD